MPACCKSGEFGRNGRAFLGVVVGSLHKCCAKLGRNSSPGVLHVLPLERCVITVNISCSQGAVVDNSGVDCSLLGQPFTAWSWKGNLSPSRSLMGQSLLFSRPVRFLSSRMPCGVVYDRLRCTGLKMSSPIEVLETLVHQCSRHQLHPLLHVPLSANESFHVVARVLTAEKLLLSHRSELDVLHDASTGRRPFSNSVQEKN